MLPVELTNTDQVEDILFALYTRQQVVQKMIREAQDKMNGSQEFELKQELLRLDILKDRLEIEVGPQNYKDALLDNLFPELMK